MSITLPVTLVKMDSFDTTLFDFSLTKDVPFAGGKQEANEDASTVISFKAQPHTWVICANEKPIGLLNIDIPKQSKWPYYCNAFIHIFTPYRRKGYARFVTRVMIQAFRRNPSYKLYTLIDDGEGITATGLRKSFPDIHAETQANEKTQEVFTEDQLFFDLSTGGTGIPTSMERPIYSTISSWVLDELEQQKF